METFYLSSKSLFWHHINIYTKWLGLLTILYLLLHVFAIENTII